MSHDAPQHANAGFDWADPHHFHHDDAGHHVDHGAHHVTSWQRLFFVLVALLILTALTVGAATAEAWAVGMGVHITHFWNVIIALSIALVKAAMVCMYFMHLKHDNPLNTMILLTTLFIFGLFILFTGIDLTERDAVNPIRAEYVQAGGTGVGMVAGGGSLGGNITTVRKQQKIKKIATTLAAEHGRETPSEEDLAHATTEFWHDFYHHKVEDHHGKVPHRHADDLTNEYAGWLAHHFATHGGEESSTSQMSRPRHGLTPGLFDGHDAAHHGDGHAPADAPPHADPAHGDH